jgi:ABC-type Fe3+-hydroxamate transport system substrate-binding protein
MFSNMKSRVRSVIGVGVIAALVVAGLAIAQDNGGSGSQSGTPAGHPPGPPPGAGIMLGPGPGGKNLTYAEFHAQVNGQDQVTRLDNGKIDSVSDSEITITENDGSQVTIPVDDETRVVAGPGSNKDVTDLEQGQQVQVGHREDGAADVIMVPPSRAELQKQLRNLPKPPAGARVFRAGRPGGPQGFAIPLPPPPGVSEGSDGSHG